MQNSFLQLYPTLSLAKQASDNPDGSTSNQYDFIKLSPYEAYLQISNSDVPINFGGDYKAELVGCNGLVLSDVTDRVFIAQGTNSVTGIDNIAFELINLPAYYGYHVYLKLTQTTDDTNIFYSTPFTIHPDSTGTSRIDFIGTGVMFGMDFTNFPFINSIRIACSYRKINPVNNAQTYDQSSGSRIAKSFTRVLGYEFIIEYINNLGNLAMSALEQLPVIFVNGSRASSVNYSTDEVLGNSNFYRGKLTAFLNKDEKYVPVYQIAQPFSLVAKSPFGVYTLPPPIPAPTGLSYDTPNTYTIGIAITLLTPTVTGTVVSYSVSPALPTGLSINTSTGIISGTPTVITAINTYTVTATNTSGFDTFGVEITVEAVPTFPLLHSPVFSNIFN